MSTPLQTPRQRLLSLRGLLPFLRPHRPMLIGWLAALALSSSATLFFPVAFKHMIDQGFARGTSVDRWFVLLFVVAVVLDVTYQVIVFGWVYPLQTLLVSVVLAIVPYVLIRGPVTRFKSRR